MGRRKDKAGSAAGATTRPRSSSSSSSSERQAVLALLMRLGSAPWAAWALADEDLVAVSDAVGPVVSSSIQQGDYAPVAALLVTLQCGTQLFAQAAGSSSSSERSKAQQNRLLCCLWGTFADDCLDCCRGVVEGVTSSAQAQAAAVQVSVQVARAGLLGSVGAACSCLARIINAHAAAAAAAAAAAEQQQTADGRQQQQQQAAGSSALQDSRVPLLAGLLLRTLTLLCAIWPGGRGAFSPAIVPVIPAAAELALAVLRNPAAHTHPVNTAGLQPVHEAVLLAWPIAEASARLNLADLSQLPEQLASSSSVRQLLLLRLALAVQRMRQLQLQQQGAPAAQQQQQAAAVAVPPYHQHMLQALGLRGEVAWQIQSDNLQAAKVDITVMMHALAANKRKQQQQQQQQQDQHQQQNQQDPQALQHAAALPGLLLEAMVLQPIASIVGRGVDLLHGTVEQVYAKQLPATSEQFTAEVLPVLVRLLLPAVREAALSAEAGPGEREEAATEWMRDIGRSLLAMTIHSPLSMPPVFLQQPQQYSCLLEAAIRNEGATDANIFAAEVVSSAIIEAAIQDNFVQHLSPGAIQSSTVPWTPDSRQSVFAMLISCGKVVQAGVAASSAQGGSRMGKRLQEALDSAANLMVAVRCMLQAGSSDADNSSSSAQAAAPAAGPAGTIDRLLVVALARCLVVTGIALQQQHTATSSESISDTLRQAWEAVAALGSAVASIAAAEPSALPAPVLQQLQQQQAQLQQGLQQQVDSAASAPIVGAADGGVSGAAAAGLLVQLGEQLVAYGAAVAAQLPVQQCCNHHGCTNCDTVSELELASGQSCVCGGCRVARYCSRSCQVAHYKDWHKAVCRRITQQRQQQQ